MDAQNHCRSRRHCDEGALDRFRIDNPSDTSLAQDILDNRILDWTSGQMSSLLGHAHPEIVAVVERYVKQLDHVFSGMVTQPVVDLCEKLTALLPRGLDRCMFLSTGSETNECAFKLAKMYTGGFEVVSFAASYRKLY